MTDEEAYAGGEELEALEHAVRYNDHIARLFADELPKAPAPVPRVLEFGAGIGTIAVAFTKRTGVRPVALELDRAQRETLVRRGFEAKTRLEEVEPRSFDLVYSSNVLEHIEDDVGALRAIRSRLRPAGRLALWVPAFPILWTSLDDRVGHVRRYTARTLRGSLESAGFRVERLCYQDSLGFFAALAFRATGRSGRIDARSIRVYDSFVFPISSAVDLLARDHFGKNLFAVAVPEGEGR